MVPRPLQKLGGDSKNPLCPQYAGGLWLLWKKDEVDIFILSSIEQEIHTTVKVYASNLSWLISPVYASPPLGKGKVLWSNLVEKAQLHNLP